MTADAYCAAVAVEPRRVPLQREPPETAWDPLLEPAMREGGVVAYEEEVRSKLLCVMES